MQLPLSTTLYNHNSVWIFIVFIPWQRSLYMWTCICISVTFRAFQCSSFELSLSCPTGQTIEVLEAFYGHYEYTSTQADLTCKPSHAGVDCTESIETFFPADWFVLTELCNGETECSFTAQAGFMTTCSSDTVTADYTHVLYQCLPGKENVRFVFRPNTLQITLICRTRTVVKFLKITPRFSITS